RAADCSAELIPLTPGFRRPKGVRKEIVGIQRIVAEEFINRSANGVRSRTDCGVYYGPGAAAEFCGVAVRLDLKFLERFNRRLDDLHVFAPVRTRIRDVVHTVEEKQGIECAIPVN